MTYDAIPRRFHANVSVPGLVNSKETDVSLQEMSPFSINRFSIREENWPFPKANRNYRNDLGKSQLSADSLGSVM
jgi:hypothetical protein